MAVALNDPFLYTELITEIRHNKFVNIQGLDSTKIFTVTHFFLKITEITLTFNVITIYYIFNSYLFLKWLKLIFERDELRNALFFIETYCQKVKEI